MRNKKTEKAIEKQSGESKTPRVSKGKTKKRQQRKEETRKEREKIEEKKLFHVLIPITVVHKVLLVQWALSL